MIQSSTAPQTRARVAALAQGLASEQRAMLDLWLDHWWAEVVYDIDACMRTLSADVCYRSYGARIFGEPIMLDGAMNARVMYQGLFDAGLMPGGPFDEERFSFGAWGLMMEALFTSVFPGHMLSGVPDLDPHGLYKICWRMSVAHPMDMSARVMQGEIMYPGPLIAIEPADRAEIKRLLGVPAAGR